MTKDSAAATATETDWQSIADDLASALRQALLRNPNLPAASWERAQVALVRYAGAGGDVQGS